MPRAPFGYLVGQENKGLAHMFTMMNEARQKVGLQGLGIAERAYQAARDYAKERVQAGRRGRRAETGSPSSITPMYGECCLR